MVDLSPSVEETAEKLRKETNSENITDSSERSGSGEQMDAAAAKGIETFGEINVACCNAEYALAPFEEMDDTTRNFHIDVNIRKEYGIPVRQLSHIC